MDRQKHGQDQDGVTFSPEYWETIDPFMAHKTDAIQATIVRPREALAGIKQTGPILLAFLGCGALIFSLILGLVILAAALAWGSGRTEMQIDPAISSSLSRIRQ